jgi:hypothetical protein
VSDRAEPGAVGSPDPNPVRRRARRRRELEIIAWWVVVLVLSVVLVAGGPWFLIIPIGAFGALVAANTVALARRRGPEEQALTPGRLARAAADQDPVVVAATWSPRRRAPERQRHDGHLSWSGHRLAFSADTPSPARGKAAVAPIGLVLLDAAITELRLGPPPTLLRPQVVLIEGSTTHVLDLCPGWDIASIGVGILLADEWYRQLSDLGVTTS